MAVGADLSLLVRLLRPVIGDEAGPIAARLLAEFCTLSAILAASASRRLAALTNQRAVDEHLQAMQLTMLCCLRTCLTEAPVLGSSLVLYDYLRVLLAHEPAEQFRALYLDASNRLIREEIVALGSIDSAAVHPREVMRRALDLNAAGLIFVHNHPSGDPTPSKRDIAVTRRLADLAHALEITVHDHVVVARGGCTSLRALGLM